MRNWTPESNRYVRLNADLGSSLPRLDDKARLGWVQITANDIVRRDPANRAIITEIGCRLVASSFYFEKYKSPIDNGLVVKGRVLIRYVVHSSLSILGEIKCRFADDSLELRHLGGFLSNQQTATFQPFFRIQEMLGRDIAVDKVITQDTIECMEKRAQFSMGPINICVPEQNGETNITLVLQDGESHHEHIMPISGFPRFLVKEYTQQGSSSFTTNYFDFSTNYSPASFMETMRTINPNDPLHLRYSTEMSTSSESRSEVGPPPG
jgi:hypothetical protein